MTIRTLLIVLLCSLVSTVEGAERIPFNVAETAGLRRFGYPVTASLECPQGELSDVANVRLLDEAGKEVPAQFTQTSVWPDGSIRGLDVDFAPSPGPHETQRYLVEIGEGPTQAVRKALSVTETPDEIIVTSASVSHRIRRNGQPLLTSMSFGGTEYIGADGIRTSLAPGPVKIVKRGPFNVTLNMGALRLEYVSTKSWVKITQQADTPRELAVDAHFHLARLPLLWDFGLGSWLYGNLPKAGQSASLRQHDGVWQVFTSPDSLFASAKSFDGCGHLADAERVAAFGIADAALGMPPTIDVTSEGRVRITAKRNDLTVYFHLVPQPIPVTAVTSPQAMLAPLKVTSP